MFQFANNLYLIGFKNEIFISRIAAYLPFRQARHPIFNVLS